ncbi:MULTISPECIES: GntR family transcriptional regulator [unclassified Novosphingobium]|uniref:FadR/GntR family transcriptional regulator n=2 Tax=Novosphingobium TaxID=165696 RepID=UPI0025D54BF4|nr:MULTISPECIES: GntR family transcriptional regulator [unclassified Novosphingobium]
MQGGSCVKTERSGHCSFLRKRYSSYSSVPELQVMPSAKEKPNFAPIKTQRAFEAICEQIRGQLANGTLKTGDKLPAERELAIEFQVSRSALREALRSLEVAGIIRNTKGVKGGSFIQAAEPDRIVQAMQDYVHLGNVTLDELTEARLATLDIIVRLACERASESDLAELEAIAARTKQVTGVEARYECAAQFYEALARATKNRIYGIFVNSLASILHEFVQGPDYETLQETLIDSRLRLIRHLRKRDAEAAAQEMRKHLERLHRHVRKTMKARGAEVA